MRVAVISDVHFPDHDKKAWSLTKKIIPDLNIDLIYLLGDIFDFEPISRFMIKPSIELNIQKDIDSGIESIKELITLFPGKMKFFPGNHCDRLNKYLYNNAKRLSGLRSLKLYNLLKLDELNIEYFDRSKNRFDKIGKLHFCHGDEIRVSTKFPASNLLMRVNDNLICGHYHKFDRATSRSISKESHGVFVNACLQNLNPDWVGFSQWQQGFTVIDFTSTGYFKVDFIEFFQNKNKLVTLYNNKLYIV